MINPCKCCGSLKWIHQKCLLKWIRVSNKMKCPQCKYTYEIEISYNSWIHQMCDSAYIPTILAICLIATIFYVFHNNFR